MVASSVAARTVAPTDAQDYRFAGSERAHAAARSTHLEAVEAKRYVETGQKTGNVVLRVSEGAPGEQTEPAAKHEEEVPAMKALVQTVRRACG